MAKSLSPLIKKILAEAGLEKKSVRHWVFHSGGAKILDAIQKALALTDQNMRISRKILRNYGNLSSPTVLFGLEDLLSRVRSIKSGDKVLIASFGAGFSAYACLLELR
ncbi:MAG: hypothetical protein A2901_01475 [Elusimicrobia bacterium RIFCSPLOWO2_01_FULL_54_10]|nr:MAG: hypothetical protein A2901_01475 [Elusimicrobia bacterium RIFCSPLOWO2_01_FULL_54_10]